MEQRMMSRQPAGEGPADLIGRICRKQTRVASQKCRQEAYKIQKPVFYEGRDVLYNAKDFAMAVCGAVLPCDSLFGKPAPESVLRPLSQFSSKKLINTPAVNNGTRIRIL